MCTLAVAFQTDRRFPLVVAANRDERLARPSETWALRDLASGARWAGPRDVEAGGTWIGVSAAGVFAGVTNFHSGQPPDRARRSRGELVPLALAHRTAASARAALATLDARAWNPFHLLVADGHEAHLWRFDGESASLDALGPGLHVVTESSADGRCPRGDLVRARWPLDSSPARLASLLALHGPARETSVCVHLEGAPYGTRSSAILRLAGALDASELLVADGPPCRVPFEDRTALLASLARLASP
jgi:uncharacterized protein with NRDE domain